MTRNELETALDAGTLEVQWGNSRWYSVRRNGATKLWKRDTERFVVPCKTKFRDCFVIAFYTYDCRCHPSEGHTLNSPYLRVKE